MRVRPLPHPAERIPPPTVGARIDGALGRLSAAVDELASIDMTTLSEPTLTDALRRIARVDGRLDGLQARLVAAADAAGVPDRAGAASTTAWVAQQTGRGGGQAARTDRLARAGATNPALVDAVASGRVGPDQAARLASGLDRGTMEPADADHLLRRARDLPPAQFNRETKRIEGRRHQQRLREREQAAHAARSVRVWRDDDDALRLEARHAPADGDVVQKALNAFVRPDGKDVPDDLRRSHAQLLADAMVDLCRTALDHGLGGDVGGVRPHVTVTTTIDAMAALQDAEVAGAIAVTDLGTTLSAAAFQRLACDATFRRLVTDPAGMPLDVGRATRKWSSAQRAAIAAADGGCRGPGCELPPDRTEVHHLTWWRHGGRTDVDNGVLVCNHAHSLVHDEGWTLAMDPMTRECTWTAPDGTVLTTRPHGLPVAGLADTLPPAARPVPTTPPHRRAGSRDPRHTPRSGPSAQDERHPTTGGSQNPRSVPVSGPSPLRRSRGRTTQSPDPPDQPREPRDARPIPLTLDC